MVVINNSFQHTIIILLLGIKRVWLGTNPARGQLNRGNKKYIIVILVCASEECGLARQVRLYCPSFSVRCVALRNLDLLIKTDRSVICPLCC